MVKNLLPAQETGVQSLVQEDPTYLGQLSLCATTTEPVPGSLGAAAPEPVPPRVHAPEKDEQLPREARTP